MHFLQKKIAKRDIFSSKKIETFNKAKRFVYLMKIIRMLGHFWTQRQSNKQELRHIKSFTFSNEQAGYVKNFLIKF